MNTAKPLITNLVSGWKKDVLQVVTFFFLGMGIDKNSNFWFDTAKQLLNKEKEESVYHWEKEAVKF